MLNRMSGSVSTRKSWTPSNIMWTYTSQKILHMFAEHFAVLRWLSMVPPTLSMRLPWMSTINAFMHPLCLTLALHLLGKRCGFWHWTVASDQIAVIDKVVFELIIFLARSSQSKNDQNGFWLSLKLLIAGLGHAQWGWAISFGASRTVTEPIRLRTSPSRQHLNESPHLPCFGNGRNLGSITCQCRDLWVAKRVQPRSARCQQMIAANASLKYPETLVPCDRYWLLGSILLAQVLDRILPSTRFAPCSTWS